MVREIYPRLTCFLSGWMRKDTPYLMWLLSPFTAFEHEGAVELGSDPSGSFCSTTLRTVDEDIELALRAEIVALADEFRGRFGVETIDRLARDSLEIMTATGARHYLAQLAGRFTRERLAALARAGGPSENDHPEVLFVCGRNAGRSQMAAVFAQTLGVGRIGVHSAGSWPAGQVDPAVTAVMSELGIDLGEAFPKPLTDEVIRAVDIVITMGCGDVCPLFADKRYEDWPLDDPHGQPVTGVREIRDTIRRRVAGLVASLEAARAH